MSANNIWAFPRPAVAGYHGVIDSAEPGMTLRQWYAGQALAGMGAIFGVPAEDVAEKAVQLADAMLAALAKEKAT